MTDTRQHRKNRTGWLGLHAVRLEFKCDCSWLKRNWNDLDPLTSFQRHSEMTFVVNCSYINWTGLKFSAHWGICDGPSHSGIVYCGLISIPDIFWKKWTLCTSEQKEKRQTRLLSATGEKSSPVMGWGCKSAPGKNNLHFCHGSINGEKYRNFITT